MPKDEAQLFAADELYVFSLPYSLIICFLRSLELRLLSLIDILQLRKRLVLPQGTQIMVLQSWGTFSQGSYV